MAGLPNGTVSFLFTDIEGSTKLLGRFPQAYSAALFRHDAILREAVGAHGGWVFESVGDAIYAAFPRAGEAVAAALQAQLRLGAEDWGELGALSVRMALNSGDVERRGDHYFGPALYRCARLMSIACGGQVLISHATAELARGELPADASLRRLGRHRLRDFAEPEEVFQVAHPQLRFEFPSLASRDAVPHNLPGQLTAFVGRTTDLAELKAALVAGRLVTVTGPGGTGKTRLALQAAADLLGSYEDGVFFVALADLRDGALVSAAIARALGLSPLRGHALRETVADHLRARSVLLVLDNFEQILGAAPLVTEMLQAAPRLAALVTSRAPLRVRGEHQLSLGPLGLPPPGGTRWSPETLLAYDAVRLFVTRVQEIDPKFVLRSEDAPTVVAICERLDALPLAIELAASRTRVLPPRQLLERLERRLDSLRGGARDLPARQRTLRDTVAWSYELLEASDRGLFARLGVFAGAFTLFDAEAICSDNKELGAVDGIEHLLENSLLRREINNGEPLFQMLETIREYALERLNTRGEIDVVRDLQVGHYLQLLTPLPERPEDDAAEWGERVAHLLGEIGPAIDWCLGRRDAERAARLWVALFALGDCLGNVAPARARAESVLADLDSLSPQLRWEVISVASTLWRDAGDFKRARQLLGDALAAAEGSGEPLRIAGVLHKLGNLAYIAGDIAEAQRSFAESLKRFGSEGRRPRSTLNNLAVATRDLGDLDRAAALLEEVGVKARQEGRASDIVRSLTNLGEVAYLRGEFGRAATLFEEALREADRSGSWRQSGNVLANLALVAEASGDLEGAAAYCVRALSLLQGREARRLSATCAVAAAGVASGRGDPRAAARLLGAVDALGIPVPPPHRFAHQSFGHRTRSLLGEEKFALEFSAGRELPLSDAIEEALFAIRLGAPAADAVSSGSGTVAKRA